METNGHVLEDASPPSPSPRPHRGLFFRQPDPELEETTPAPRTSPETAGEASLPLEGAVSASDSEWQNDELDESAATSSKASSGSAVRPLAKAAQKAAIAKGVLIGSEMAHRFAARTEGQQRVGLYRADEEDAEGVADPLADILGRHGGVTGGLANPDAADAVRMMVALAGYASKQIVAGMQAREFDNRVAAGGTVDV